MYAVVEFLRGSNVKECALVPIIWLVENNKRCYWPRTKNDDQFRSLVQTNGAYELSWPTYAVHRVLHTGADYGAAEKFTANIIENCTSEDGNTTQPITEKKLTSEDTILSDSDDENHDTEIPRKKRKKQHKRNKSSKKNKRRMETTSCSDDSEHSQEQENVPPLAKKYERSLTGLQRHDITINAEGRDIAVTADFPACNGPSGQDSQRRGISINAEGRDISVNADFVAPPESCLVESSLHRNVNTTPQRNVSIRDISTPCSNHLIPGFRGAPLITSEERILSDLTQIKSSVDQNQIILGQILRINQALSQVQNITIPQGFPEFPISSLDIFEEFDKMLQNEEHRMYLMQRLASVGGLSQQQAVMNMLKFLMTNSLAMEYNWAGREKISFRKTTVMEVLNGAAKLAFKGKPESSDANIASAVKDWLKLATSRHTYSITGKKTVHK